MDEMSSGDNGIINPSLLRVFRVARVARLLRILHFAKGIRQLLVALIISLPALLNVGTLLFLVIFIYAVVGMSTFGHIKKQGNLDETVNFETFGRSMLVLFRLSTGAGWNDILESLMISPPDCDPLFGGFPNGNCGYPAGAVIYLVSYIFIVFLIIVNMYIAIILENVNRAQEGELIITKENLDSYYRKWSSFVSDGKQYLQVYQVSDFVALLDEPFKIAKPNEHELVRMGINVRMGYRVKYFDLLRCLVKRLLEERGQSPLAFEEIASKLEVHFRRSFRRKNSKTLCDENCNTPDNTTGKEENSSTIQNGTTAGKPDFSTTNTAAPRARYRDPFSTTMLVQSAARRFLDKRSVRAEVTLPMSHGVSSDNIGKCPCSPLSSVSSDQEINNFMSGVDFVPLSRSQTPDDSVCSNPSPESYSDDPFDSEGDSV